mgnify:CR=1 FL=1
MKVAGLQHDISWEDAPGTLERVEALVGDAATQGARLLVLPEMFATGFSMNEALVTAAEATIVERLEDWAKCYGIWIIAGVAVKGTPRPRNAALVIQPDGRSQGRFEKLHPFSLAREHEHFDGGESLPSFLVEGVRVTVLVCYDLRFPEPFRIAAADTDLFCVIANWPETRRSAWQSLLVARAIENQAYVLGVNRCGTGDGLSYAGDSALLDPFGECLARAPIGQGMVVGLVDPQCVNATRTRFPFLDDRRPTLYSRLDDARRGAHSSDR